VLDIPFSTESNAFKPRKEKKKKEKRKEKSGVILLLPIIINECLPIESQ